MFDAGEQTATIAALGNYSADFPTHHSASYVRKNNCPPEMTGDAQVISSPMVLVPSSSKSGVAFTMNVSPDLIDDVQLLVGQSNR